MINTICTYCIYPLDGACVYVNGKECNPSVSDCIIAEANNVGVFVDNHAKVSTDRMSQLYTLVSSSVMVLGSV